MRKLTSSQRGMALGEEPRCHQLELEGLHSHISLSCANIIIQCDIEGYLNHAIPPHI